MKKVILNYGPTGRSRGSATVFFSRSGAAAEAVRLDGTPVDGKKMRVCDFHHGLARSMLLTTTTDRSACRCTNGTCATSTEASLRTRCVRFFSAGSGLTSTNTARSNKPKNAVKKDGKQAGAAKPKNQAANTNGSAGDKKAKKEKSGRAGRAKAKTAEELDAEMQDYFGSGEGAAASTNGAPTATTNGGDTGMVDEVM